ncbi:MAG: tRNA pseudouridine(55) synthase TruB [Microbacteriaceae bacterium]
MPSTKRSSATSGILLIDKPQGVTSHDVVARTRKAAGTRKVGHAGTLDPMATGLLVMGLNSSTRLLTFVVGLDKEYFATIRLGQTTSTDDAEGDVVVEVDAGAITADAIAAGIAPLTGLISQVPSSVSAIKVDGKRAYDLVRAGEVVHLKSRNVTVSAFEMLEVRVVDRDARDAGAEGIRFIDVDVRVECSSGTYIRALARDLGASLGVGGHLTALRRTRVGPFSVMDAATLANVAPAEQLLAPAVVAGQLFDVHHSSESEVTDLMHGKRVDASGWQVTGGPIAVVSPNGRLVGLVEVTAARAKTIVNFPSDEIPREETPSGENSHDEVAKDEVASDEVARDEFARDADSDGVVA